MVKDFHNHFIVLNTTYHYKQSWILYATIDVWNLDSLLCIWSKMKVWIVNTAYHYKQSWILYATLDVWNLHALLCIW